MMMLFNASPVDRLSLMGATDRECPNMDSCEQLIALECEWSQRSLSSLANGDAQYAW